MDHHATRIDGSNDRSLVLALRDPYHIDVHRLATVPFNNGMSMLELMVNRGTCVDEINIIMMHDNKCSSATDHGVNHIHFTSAAKRHPSVLFRLLSSRRPIEAYTTN